MFTIENEHLLVEVNVRGAELNRIYAKQTGLDYLWNADPAFWAKKSPVLFPIVGTLEQDQYYFEGKAYQLPRHGFAREMDFTLTASGADRLELTLNDTQQTHAVFPFAFSFSIIYTLDNDRLTVEYRVGNPASVPLWFSVGGHPAFKLPIETAFDYTDYYLEFDQAETAGRWQISPKGLIEDHSVPLLNKERVLPLTHQLFLKDAIVFKQLASDAVTLKSNRSTHGLRFEYPGFPFLGIWAAPNANFVCIEPWCGIADSVNASQQLTEKEGIEQLDGNEVFSRRWTVQLF